MNTLIALTLVREYTLLAWLRSKLFRLWLINTLFWLGSRILCFDYGSRIVILAMITRLHCCGLAQEYTVYFGFGSQMHCFVLDLTHKYTFFLALAHEYNACLSLVPDYTV